MRPLQQVWRRGRRRAQSALLRGVLAHSSKMVSIMKITAENHSQAGAAWPRAGPETIVRLAACICTRVKTVLVRQTQFRLQTDLSGQLKSEVRFQILDCATASVSVSSRAPAAANSLHRRHPYHQTGK